MSDLIVAKVEPKCGFQRADDSLCGTPALYMFELARDIWHKEHPDVPTDNPLLGYACSVHGKDAREMPGMMWIRTLL